MQSMRERRPALIMDDDDGQERGGDRRSSLSGSISGSSSMSPSMSPSPSPIGGQDPLMGVDQTAHIHGQGIGGRTVSLPVATMIPLDVSVPIPGSGSVQLQRTVSGSTNASSTVSMTNLIRASGSSMDGGIDGVSLASSMSPRMGGDGTSGPDMPPPPPPGLVAMGQNAAGSLRTDFSMMMATGQRDLSGVLGQDPTVMAGPNPPLSRSRLAGMMVGRSGMQADGKAVAGPGRDEADLAIAIGGAPPPPPMAPSRSAMPGAERVARGRSRGRASSQSQDMGASTRKYWTPEETSRLQAGYDQYGRDWKDVAIVVGTRSPKQCHNKWVRDFQERSEKRGAWDEKEVERLILAIKKHQHRWREVAKELPGRNEFQCKNKFHGLQRNHGIDLGQCAASIGDTDEDGINPAITAVAMAVVAPKNKRPPPPPKREPMKSEMAMKLAGPMGIDQTGAMGPAADYGVHGSSLGADTCIPLFTTPPPPPPPPPSSDGLGHVQDMVE